MASKRNRIDILKDYIQSFNISININKNKAQGNRGFFKAIGSVYRIDIAKGLTEDQIIRTLVHEFCHFIHYKYDRTLKSLDFIFENYDEALNEELIKNTVELIPKETVSPLFDTKEKLNNEIKLLARDLLAQYSDFKLQTGSKKAERSISNTPYKLLLKHDRVKILGFFSSKLYSIESLKKYRELSDSESNYILLKSKQRALKRISSRISRYNRYYNAPTELFARCIEMYVTNPSNLRKNTPKLFEEIESIIEKNKIPELTKLIDLALN